MAFDQVLAEVGEFGLFQKVIICSYVIASMVLAASSFWTQVYILLVPSHRCRTSYEDDVWLGSNVSHEITSTNCHLNISDYSYPNGNASDSSSTCPYGWVYDYSNIYHSFSSQHDWVCDNSWRIYTTHTCYWIGGAMGCIIFGSMSDRFGRKRAFLGSLAFTILGDIITFFAYNYESFIIARFITAIGDVNLSTASFVWAIEYIGPEYRVMGLAIWSVSFTVCSTIMPFMVFALTDWRYILCIVWSISVITLISAMFVPESASWLMVRGRKDDAAKCIHQVAKFNGKPHTLQQIRELLEKKSTSTSENKSPSNGEIKLDNQVKSLSFMESMIGLIRTPNMRKKMFLLIILWMIASMCYIGIGLETSNLPLSFRLSYAVGGLSELPANIMCLLALDRIGRRWANVTFFVIGGFLGICVGSFIKNNTAVIVMTAIMRLCNTATFDIVFTLTSELLPTVVRGRGVSITRICGGLANALSPFIFSLSEVDKLLPFLVFGILCVLGGVLTLFLPEPAGQPLPHTLEDGENFGKTQSFFYCPFSPKNRSSSETKNNLQLPVMENKAFEHSPDGERKTYGSAFRNKE